MSMRRCITSVGNKSACNWRNTVLRKEPGIRFPCPRIVHVPEKINRVSWKHYFLNQMYLFNKTTKTTFLQIISHV